MVETILFPSAFYDETRVDPDLQREYDAACTLFKPVLFGYDRWLAEGKLVLHPKPDSIQAAVYRGWMFKPEKYRRLFEQLLENNIRLVTSPGEYELMHVFPNIYPRVREDTARILLFPLHEKINIQEIISSFPRFMVKDHVKSVKGTSFPSFFDSATTQEELDQYMDIFYQFRGDLLTGGICIKEYLELKRYGKSTNEYRVFYIDHTPATICRNSCQGNFTTEPPKELIEKYRDLESVYYTLDFAELADGTWKILEAGDGSVSGLSEGQDHAHYFRTLFHLLNR